MAAGPGDAVALGANGRGDPTSRPRRCRVLSRCAGSSGPAAPEHHRCPGRPPADDERDRIALDHLQRRDLQSCRAPSSARASRTPLSNALRYRNNSARFRAVWPRMPAAFHGMFAFAIWDAARRRLFCARDRLGIKPFYYYWDGRLFAFASEIKALLEHPAISPALAEDLLPEVLAFGYTSGDLTLFRNIQKLMPGHRLVLDTAGRRSRTHDRAYWDVPKPEAPGISTRRSWIAETRRRLEQSVEMHLMSDVPLGVFLSGGVDSSAIAALAQRAVTRPCANLRGRLLRGPIQRVEPCPAGGPGDRNRASRSHHRHRRFFRRAAPADLAGRRTDRVALQRVPVLCLEAGFGARQGSADGRRQRRDFRRL